MTDVERLIEGNEDGSLILGQDFGWSQNATPDRLED